MNYYTKLRKIMIMLFVLSMGLTFTMNTQASTDALSNGSFESGSGSDAYYWGGHDGRVSGGAYLGTWYMGFSTYETISQSISVYSNYISYISVYYKTGPVQIRIYWDSTHYDSYDCTGTPSSWTYCKWDNSFVSNENLISIVFVANSAYTSYIDFAVLWVDTPCSPPYC